MKALLFTDVVDSTLLTERLGDARAAQVWASTIAALASCWRAHRGREIDRTDGFFLLFDDALDAARYRTRVPRRAAARWRSPLGSACTWAT